MKRIIAILAIASISIIACNTSTIPGECLEALESYNVPEEAIELIKEKAGGDLNIIQRTAVRLAFEQAGVDDLCGHLAE